MKAAAYCRVSSEEQKQNQTIKSQKEAINQYGSNNSIKLSGFYLDEGITGAMPIEKRPAGKRLFAAIHAGLVDTVIVWKLNRITREEPLVSAPLLLKFKQLGIKIISLNEDIDLDSLVGQLKVIIDTYSAAQERENIRTNVISGHERSAREGKWQGGKPPFGYRKNQQGQLEIYPEQAEIVREIFSRCIAGESNIKIAQDLNDRGIPDPLSWDRHGNRKKARKWWDSTVGKILRHEAYTGTYTWRRTNFVFEGGEFVTQKPSDEKDRITYEIPALVSRVDFERARKACQTRKRLASRNSHVQYMLKGLVKCGIETCGQQYFGSVSTSIYKGEQKNYRYYSCGSGWRGQKRCGNKTVKADELENLVFNLVEKFIDNPEDYLNQLQEAQNQNIKSEEIIKEDLKEVDHRIERLHDERQRLVRALRKGILDEDEFDREASSIREELELMERRRELILRHREVIEAREAEMMNSVTLLESLQSTWKALGIEDRTYVCRNLINTIEVCPSINEKGKMRAQIAISFKYDTNRIRINLETKGILPTITSVEDKECELVFANSSLCGGSQGGSDASFKIGPNKKSVRLHGPISFLPPRVRDSQPRAPAPVAG
jgi:site-specific DNA recombinase